jgi:hypothetical protein
MPATGLSGASPNAAGTANTPQTGAPTTQAAAGLLTSPTWQQNIAGYLYGSYAGQIGQYGLQGALAQESLGLAPETLAAQEQNAVSGAGFDFAGALLGYQGLGLQSQGLAQQGATAAGQQGLEQAGYAITSQKYGQEQQQAALEEQQRQTGLQSGAAGAGTLHTQGAEQAQTTAAQEYRWQQATIYRQQQLAELGQQSEQLGYETKAGQLALGQQQLALTAQKQGLSTQQAQQQLAFGLSQLGVKATPASLLSSIATAEEGGGTAVRGLVSQAGLIGGLGASFGLGG